ncbi:EAL domain-containing protein [Mesorhizobium sp.]|uniref:putative bifunctional diguanylate cyclase/phosphodiesterase n=1 Tax=Mesorhizobium sp. TaxID=1871066 RepID=UPI000FE7A4C6|nr:EAL domain-containing protein [Mesorhizobium sp.]RWP71515.1 MAG: EAL domain-containing protein [Mesorhizobium sp.]
MQTTFGTGQATGESTDLAFTDPLTGLGNHRRFFDKVDRLISDRADDPAPFTVGILDLDGFKPINDLFGHKAGDEILIQAAMRLRASMDSHSTVCRIGADEYAFLYPMVFSEEAAAEKSRTVIEILSAPYDVGERTARLSASVGCSMFYSGDETARSWPKDLFLSFNLSPSQLVDQNTGLHILAILDRTGFDPRRLEIEITETGLMNDPASAEKTVGNLRRVGIRVSLDDFGTGQSSLGRLREFHFDKLKIDRAFVSSILDDRPSEHIIRAILAMCEGLGMDVVAEGIEQEAQAERLVQFGCAGGQGFLFGRPVDADATLGYLRDSFRGALRVKAI